MLIYASLLHNKNPEEKYPRVALAAWLKKKAVFGLTKLFQVLILAVCFILQWPLTCQKIRENLIPQIMTPSTLSSLLVCVTEGISKRSQSCELYMLPRNKLTGTEYVGGATEISTHCSKLSVVSPLRCSVFSAPLSTVTGERNPLQLLTAADAAHTTPSRVHNEAVLFSVQVLQPCYQNLGDD